MNIELTLPLNSHSNSIETCLLQIKSLLVEEGNNQRSILFRDVSSGETERPHLQTERLFFQIDSSFFWSLLDGSSLNTSAAF